MLPQLQNLFNRRPWRRVRVSRPLTSPIWYNAIHPGEVQHELDKLISELRAAGQEPSPDEVDILWLRALNIINDQRIERARADQDRWDERHRVDQTYSLRELARH